MLSMDDLCGSVWGRRVAGIVGLVWLLVTLAALTAMYQLWWTREWKLYGNASVETQREEVFRRSGLPVSLLDDIRRVQRLWPVTARYQAEGDPNQLSYVKYLLLPRVPAGETEFFLRVEDGGLRFSPDDSTGGRGIEGGKYGPNPLALLLPCFFVTGISLLIGRSSFFSTLSFPEKTSLAVFILAVSVMLSWGMTRSGTAGFIVVALLGTVGLLLGLPRDRKWGNTAMMDCAAGLCATRSWRQRLFLWGLPLGIVVAATVWSMAMSVVVLPDDWDAWAMWGAKAKIIALGNGTLADVKYFGHSDYPLLWPSVWAFSGWCGGGWEEHWSRGLGPVFLFLCAWEMSFIVGRLSGRSWQGWLTAAVFCSAPMVPLLASWSYAEAPLWLLYTCSFGNLLLWRRSQEKRHLGFASLFAVAAMYTKNEGTVFFVLCFLWLILREPRLWRDIFCWYAAPAILLYLPWFFWIRRVLGLGSRHMEGLGLSSESLARAFSRLPALLNGIGRMWMDLRQWNLIVAAICLFSLWRFTRTGGRLTGLTLPWIMLLVYAVVIGFHPDEVSWQVGTSWNRLTVQALPLFLLCIGGSAGKLFCPRPDSSVGR